MVVCIEETERERGREQSYKAAHQPLERRTNNDTQHLLWTVILYFTLVWPAPDQSHNLLCFAAQCTCTCIASYVWVYMYS